MLMSDLKHDFVRTFVAPLLKADFDVLGTLVNDMKNEGANMLSEERIPAGNHEHYIKFDCRYLKQYHEVSFVITDKMLETQDTDAIAEAFHAEHNRLYGYSLAEQNVPVEIINVRVQSVGRTEKPSYKEEPFDGADPKAAEKGRRKVYIPETNAFAEVPVYDGHALKHGNKIVGPAMIEQVTTAIFVSQSYDCVCDRFGSFALYLKGREDLIKGVAS